LPTSAMNGGNEENSLSLRKIRDHNESLQENQ
jgi:hypothetical protein